MQRVAKPIALHEGVIRPALIAELESFRAPGGRVSSYYVNLYLQGPETVLQPCMRLSGLESCGFRFSACKSLTPPF